jgi:hypothetical protein
MTSSDPTSQVGYCGLHCNACGIRQEKIKTAVNNLRDIIAAYGFDKIMPELAKMEPSVRTNGSGYTAMRESRSWIPGAPTNLPFK